MSADVVKDADTRSMRQTTTSPSGGAQVYQTLPTDGMRLVRVLNMAPSSHDHIQLEMRVCSWRENPPYTALSYEWGEATLRHTVLINGSKVMIRENLWHFLRDAVREAYEWLWVDSLSINQSDLQERSAQVSLMTVIYRLAERTIIWLGPSSSSSDAAMQYVTRSAAPGQRAQAADAAATQAFIAMCSRSYWTRLWIFQELVLSGRRQLACGRAIAPFEGFRRLVTHCSEYFDDLEICRQIQTSAAHRILLLTDLQAQRISLLTLIQDTSFLQCTEPLDKVYALLGTTPLGCNGLAPDYSKTLYDLLNIVLHMHHKQVRSPENVVVVAQQCRELGLFAEAADILRPHAEADFLDSTSSTAIGAYNHATAGLAFTWSIKYDHGPILSLLIKRRPDEASLWLWKAIRDKNYATTKLLLGLGATPCEDMEYGKTFSQLLTQACSVGAEEVIVVLLDQCNAMALTSATSLLWHDFADGLTSAATYGHMHIVDILLRRVASYELSDDRVDPMLGHGYAYRLNAVFAALWHDKRAIAEHLLSECRSIQQQRSYHTAAISRVMKSGDERLAQTLLSLGVLSSGSGGHELVESAIRHHNPRMVELLVARGATIDGQFVVGNTISTPFTYAASLDSQDIVALLLTEATSTARRVFLQHGATSIGVPLDALTFNASGRAHAAKSGHSIAALDYTDIDESYHGQAIGVTRLETIPEALAAGKRHPYELYRSFPVEYHLTDWLLKWSPVWIAAKHGSVGMLRVLLKNGAHLRHSTATRMSKTSEVLPTFLLSHSIGALYIAIVFGHNDTVNFLLGQVPSVVSLARHHILCSRYDSMGSCKETWHGLYVAVASGFFEIAETLLKAGVPVSEAEVRVYDRSGSIVQRAHAVSAAVKSKNTAMVDLLESYGAVDTSYEVHHIDGAMSSCGLWSPPFSVDFAHYTHEDEIRD